MYDLAGSSLIPGHWPGSVGEVLFGRLSIIGKERRKKRKEKKRKDWPLVPFAYRGNSCRSEAREFVRVLVGAEIGRQACGAYPYRLSSRSEGGEGDLQHDQRPSRDPSRPQRATASLSNRGDAWCRRPAGTSGRRSTPNESSPYTSSRRPSPSHSRASTMSGKEAAKAITSFAIVTTDAAPSVAQYHNRMPVVLDDSQCD